MDLDAIRKRGLGNEKENLEIGYFEDWILEKGFLVLDMNGRDKKMLI